MPNILVLSPHPDDESLGAGGSIIRHSDEGDTVHVVFVTSGERGGHGRDPTETTRVREGEARVAARILGVTTVQFWREPNGSIDVGERLTGRLRDLVSTLEPTALYAPHPGESHPDHATVSILATSLLQATSPPRLLGYEVWTPIAHIDHIVDITEQMPRKLAAIRAHVSQCEVLRFDAAFEGLARFRGEMHSWPGGPYAEVFVDLRKLAG
jgi:N-acetylglucosamine malate deacetylase 1